MTATQWGPPASLYVIAGVIVVFLYLIARGGEAWWPPRSDDAEQDAASVDEFARMQHAAKPGQEGLRP